MKVIWNKVTPFSQALAVVLFVGVAIFAFQFGRQYEKNIILGTPVASVVFGCDEGKTIKAEFFHRAVHLELGVLGTRYLPQTISASGARYANDDESFVFWNKGDTAFVTEGSSNTMLYANCVVRK